MDLLDRLDADYLSHVTTYYSSSYSTVDVCPRFRLGGTSSLSSLRLDVPER